MPFYERPKPSPNRRPALRNYRREHNLSVAEAAARIRVTPAAWTYIETGARNPSLWMARKIEKLTGIPCDDLRGIGQKALRKRTPAV